MNQYRTVTGVKTDSEIMMERLINAVEQTNSLTDKYDPVYVDNVANGTLYTLMINKDGTYYILKKSTVGTVDTFGYFRPFVITDTTVDSDWASRIDLTYKRADKAWEN